MPGVAAILRELAGTREGDVETEALLLPSALAANLRTVGCLGGVVEKEDRLREAQCHDALETIRSMQRTRRSVRSFRKRHIRGQRQTGRTMAIIHRLEAKSDIAVAKYRAARAALVHLRGEGPWMATLRVLEAKDVASLDSGIFDTDLPAPKKKKTGMNQSAVQFGSGSHEISWIWLMESALGSLSKDELHDSVRVEWLKSRARARSWTQEAKLIAEEKRRTLESMEAEAQRWLGRATGWTELSLPAAGGVRAYAHRQAAVYRSLAIHFQGIWSRPYKARQRKIPDRIEMVNVAEEEESEDELEGDEGLAEARQLAVNDDDPTLDE